MTNHKKPLSILIEHFNKVGWPLHMSEGKLIARATSVIDDKYPDAMIIEVERHRPILGEIYSRGLPMSNYQTYYMCYAVNVVTDKVIELADRVGELITDMPGLVEKHVTEADLRFSIEGIGADKYEISDNSTGQSATISNLNDATSFLSELIENIVNYFENIRLDLELDTLGIDASETTHLVEEYKNAMNDFVFSEAQRAWENRTEYDAEE